MSKAAQPVIAAAGPKRALVYFGRNEGPGRADMAYIARWPAAARGWRLPAEGLAALEGFARDGGAGTDVAAPRVRPRFATPFERQR